MQLTVVMKNSKNNKHKHDIKNQNRECFAVFQLASIIFCKILVAIIVCIVLIIRLRRRAICLKVVKSACDFMVKENNIYSLTGKAIVNSIVKLPVCTREVTFIEPICNSAPCGISTTIIGFSILND